jgi:DNA polymerase-3 subunit delta
VITLLTGENSFELKQALDDIVSVFDGEAERFDGSELELPRLPDLLAGATLFASNRLVIIKSMSENKALWEVLPDWLPRVGDETHLVLVEPKPDKRTKTYKDLKKDAIVKEFAQWTERDLGKAEVWAETEAKRQGATLDKKSIRVLVDRIGPDQWALHHALKKLAVMDSVTPELIADIIEAVPTENVFNLLDAALRGDTRKISQMVHTLARNQDPYMTFGLLSGQIFQLAALAVSEKPSGEVAGDIGAHPYALGKLSSHAKKLGRNGTRKLVTIFADTDSEMKSTSTDPWLLIEKALIKTTTV